MVFSFFFKKDMHLRKIWNLLHHLFLYYFTLKNFTSYEYASFQFSLKDEYAQKLCMSIFWFYYLQKKLQQKNKEPKKLDSKNQTKTCEKIEPHFYEEV
jgi:hypothetical protein